MSAGCRLFKIAQQPPSAAKGDGFQCPLRAGVVTPMKGPLDCPVPRLTLLFFGAAKDVPEAAKMVTAGTACLHFDRQANGQT